MHAYIFICMLTMKFGHFTCFESHVLHVLQFYDIFDSYKFSPKEIDAMFHVAVWPQVSWYIYM